VVVAVLRAGLVAAHLEFAEMRRTTADARVLAGGGALEARV
jgi:hypothetical protein